MRAARRILYLILPLLAAAFAAKGQFRNLDFSSRCASSKTGLCYWDLSYGTRGSCSMYAEANNPGLLIRGEALTSVGYSEQTAALPKIPGLRIIEVSARIRTENATGKGAGLNIGIYDAQDRLLNNKDMGHTSFSWIHGTTGWKVYRIRSICPEGSARVRVGAILYGKGTARFDDFKVTITNIKGKKISPVAQEYLSAACDTIMRHSLVKDMIDIDGLKKKALLIAGPAKTCADCYLAVEYLLSSLRAYGDEHSLFMGAPEVSRWQNGENTMARVRMPVGKVVDSCGYLLVPAFYTGNKKLAATYADTLQKMIAMLDKESIRGWVIDLRENTGGNQGPMIAGLGPFFSADKLGYLVNVNNTKQYWYYKNGVYGWNGEKVLQVTQPVTLSKNRPIAVLTGGLTGSSGEVVALSFTGNACTKSFGLPTWGLTIGNRSFELADGARIMLASTVMADRSGKLYQDSINPDVLVVQGIETTGDDTLRKALEWLKTVKDVK
ncbi:S41 family peptidase [Hufsiella ginkgonis]|uniref:Tail specific protease domain-containing protein n=1 Tax=Hufsiella ginkgonis TaxID=2695274 RepID=A0A7K1XXF3_9SPHI|nr:S41 family peptidase [Hufsiella ginkgonis]MXV15695.1 hypothetical protein [Hufsiella ginkgonis]